MKGNITEAAARKYTQFRRIAQSSEIALTLEYKSKIYWLSYVKIASVTPKLIKLLDKTVWLAYLALTIITPLLFSTQNTELFEVPKMLFVYFWAVVILFVTLIKFALLGKVIVPKNWVLVTLLIFVVVQVISAFFSIDKFTSIFGYPSRLNGGLLSQFAYLIIFVSALINLSGQKAKQLLNALIVSALVVSLWGIPGHFGRDPACWVLTGQLTSTCWQKEFDPTLRIFSTLGQPNWLAAYLTLVLPLSLVFLIVAKRLPLKIFFGAASLILFLAFILTNSRAGLAGMILALAVLIFLLGHKLAKINFKILVTILLVFGLATIGFGSTLFSRISEIANQNPLAGTESGQIRLIVWQGAFKIFQKYPLLGSGPETFAYAYYQVRPLTHNQTTEWNFFYNKAHNEFLNYAANTGFLGTLAYFGLITAILISLIRIFKRKARGEISQISKAIFAAILGYLANIFFGFSVVTTQFLMFLLVAATLILAKETKFWSFNLKFLKGNLRSVAVGTLLIVSLLTLSLPVRFYLADLLINRARNLQNDNLNRALIAYDNAIKVFPLPNPFYLADFAYTLAQTTVAVDELTEAERIAQNAQKLALKAGKISPNNAIITRRLATTFLLISDLDQQYQLRALELGNKITELAPTDPQSYLSLAKIQVGLGQNEEAKKSLELALHLKSDYAEARQLLEQLK